MINGQDREKSLRFYERVNRNPIGGTIIINDAQPAYETVFMDYVLTESGYFAENGSPVYVRERLTSPLYPVLLPVCGGFRPDGVMWSMGFSDDLLVASHTKDGSEYNFALYVKNTATVSTATATLDNRVQNPEKAVNLAAISTIFDFLGGFML